MLVTFSSKGWSNITMFGDVALTLLKMTGHSGTVPGALLAADVPAALVHLNQQLDAIDPVNNSRQGNGADAEDRDNHPSAVGIRLRAYPLIQMLSAAVREECDVMWEEGAPLV
jgi:hypothetical protein